MDFVSVGNPLTPGGARGSDPAAFVTDDISTCARLSKSPPTVLATAAANSSEGRAAPAAVAPLSTPVTANLLKLGGREKTKWQPREYTLTRNHLEWRDAKLPGHTGTQLPLAEIVTVQASTTMGESHGQPTDQVIVVQCAPSHKAGKKYYICAGSRQEQQQWIDRVLAAKQLVVPIRELLDYTPQDMARWVENLSPTLHAFGQPFERHHVTGELFMMLDESALKEMGVNLVGPRTLVLKELKRLKAEQRFAVREAVLWEGNQWDDPKDYLKHRRTGSQKDHYLLTSSNLVVTRTHQSTCFGLHAVTACCGCCCCWDETYQSKNSMNLEHITSVDSMTRTRRRCCFVLGHDEVHVSVSNNDNEEARAGWRNLGRMSRASRDNEVLHVKAGQGSDIAKRIRHAIEEKKMGAESPDMQRD